MARRGMFFLANRDTSLCGLSQKSRPMTERTWVGSLVGTKDASDVDTGANFAVDHDPIRKVNVKRLINVRFDLRYS